MLSVLEGAAEAVDLWEPGVPGPLLPPREGRSRSADLFLGSSSCLAHHRQAGRGTAGRKVGIPQAGRRVHRRQNIGGRLYCTEQGRAQSSDLYECEAERLLLFSCKMRFVAFCSTYAFDLNCFRDSSTLRTPST